MGRSGMGQVAMGRAGRSGTGRSGTGRSGMGRLQKKLQRTLLLLTHRMPGYKKYHIARTKIYDDIPLDA
jgi:hypothetical protein